MDGCLDGAGHPPICVLSLRSGWASCLTRVMFPPAGSAHAPALAPAPALALAPALDGVAHFCSCWPLLDDGVRPLNFSLTLLGCVAASGASAMMDGWMDGCLDGWGRPPAYLCPLSPVRLGLVPDPSDVPASRIRSRSCSCSRLRSCSCSCS